MKRLVQLLVAFTILAILGGCAGLTEGTKVGARENKDGGSYRVQKEVLRF